MKLGITRQANCGKSAAELANYRNNQRIRAPTFFSISVCLKAHYFFTPIQVDAKHWWSRGWKKHISPSIISKSGSKGPNLETSNLSHIPEEAPPPSAHLRWGGGEGGGEVGG